MAKKPYRWFVYPLDADTNKAFSRELPEENICRNIFCADGVIRTLWECPKNLLDRFWASRDSLSIDFKVFNVCGLSTKIQGRVRECTFLFTKKYLAKPKRKPIRKGSEISAPGRK